MDRSWYLKKQLNPISSNKKLDKFYNLARKNGVLGGKILGAGQSGYLLIYVNSIYQSKLISKLKKVISSIKIQRITFSNDGLKYWKIF
jgi:D-glycero-alpha-D-manno-heptose-7-phosphate kinase